MKYSIPLFSNLTPEYSIAKHHPKVKPEITILILHLTKELNIVLQHLFHTRYIPLRNLFPVVFIPITCSTYKLCMSGFFRILAMQDVKNFQKTWKSCSELWLWWSRIVPSSFELNLLPAVSLEMWCWQRSFILYISCVKNNCQNKWLICLNLNEHLLLPYTIHKV